MKRLILAFSALFLLTACRGVALEYELQFDLEDEGRQKELTAASLRVIERRLASNNEEALDLDLETRDDKTLLSVELKNDTVAGILNSELTMPFKLRIIESGQILAYSARLISRIVR